MRVTFRCDALEIEGELTLPSRGTAGAVICHPHPQYGGDMDNPIILTVTRALQQAGFSTLRFNFRGVGGSDGSYGGGVGEADDARAAVRYLIEPKAQQIVAGADHFFVGYEQAVAEAVRVFMAGEFHV